MSRSSSSLSPSPLCSLLIHPHPQPSSTVIRAPLSHHHRTTSASHCKSPSTTLHGRHGQASALITVCMLSHLESTVGPAPPQFTNLSSTFHHQQSTFALHYVGQFVPQGTRLNLARCKVEANKAFSIENILFIAAAISTRAGIVQSLVRKVTALRVEFHAGRRRERAFTRDSGKNRRRC